ncbi:MAG: glutamate 5-kinase [Rikenellaceae bacterium]
MESNTHNIKKCSRVVVKIGSNVLTRKDGTIDSTRMSALTDQVVELYKNGIEVIMISSGAVASGRSEIKVEKKLDSVSARQLYSAVGQTKLIHKYYNLFKEYGIVCGQILTTKDGLSTRRHYLNQKQCMSVMLDNGVVPIINENDTVSVTELMFTDNDELSGLISAMMNADKLIILSNIDGIYNGDPSNSSSEVIREIIPNKTDITDYISTSKSQFGRGGMLTKSRISCKVAVEGIEVIIANGKRDGILTDLLLTDKDIVCTRFLPSEKPISELKKWIAHSDGFTKGSLHINEGAHEALLGSQAISLLPVGVTKVCGEFEKDDIVEIVSPSGTHLGVGRVSISHSEAKLIAGEKGHKPMVHYDYLYIENY